MSTRAAESGLTVAQSAVLRYMIGHVCAEHRQPTMREMMAHFGWGSLNGVQSHLGALRDKGYVALERPPGGKTARVRFLRDADGSPFRGFVVA
jgi:SOS-response transcriptional repressor LexA